VFVSGRPLQSCDLLPENRTSQNVSKSGKFNLIGRTVFNEENTFYGRANCFCLTTGGNRYTNTGSHPQNRDTEQTFYRWKKLYGGLGPSETRRLKQLEDENRRLKQMVADLSLDKHMLQNVLSRKL
jgi:hypothetical protein